MFHVSTAALSQSAGLGVAKRANAAVRDGLGPSRLVRDGLGPCLFDERSLVQGHGSGESRMARFLDMCLRATIDNPAAIVANRVKRRRGLIYGIMFYLMAGCGMLYSSRYRNPYVLAFLMERHLVWHVCYLWACRQIVRLIDLCDLGFRGTRLGALR